MSRMIRKQIYIEETQDRALRAASRAFGVSQAELIRKEIGARIGEIPDPPLGGGRAWKRAMRFMRKRARASGAREADRRWTREELHDR